MTRTATKGDRLPTSQDGGRAESQTREVPAYPPGEPLAEEEEMVPPPFPVPSELQAGDLTVPVHSSLERTVQHETLRRQSADEEPEG